MLLYGKKFWQNEISGQPDKIIKLVDSMPVDCIQIYNSTASRLRLILSLSELYNILNSPNHDIYQNYLVNKSFG